MKRRAGERAKWEYECFVGSAPCRRELVFFSVVYCGLVLTPQWMPPDGGTCSSPQCIRSFF